MRALVERQNPPQQKTPSGLAHANRTTTHGPVSDSNPTLYAQRAVGNVAAPGPIHDDAEEREPNAVAGAPIPFAHDFSKVRVHTVERPFIQTKLAVSSSGDAPEQEAERVADEVVGMQSPEESEALEVDIPEGEELDGTVLPKSLSTGAAPDLSVNARDLDASASQALPSSTQRFMGPRFGYDFSSVRIHTDPHAARVAGSINAAAFTYGRHIYFGSGRFDQHTASGRRLLAHELTHVVQQGGGDSSSAMAKIHRSALRRSEIHSVAGGAARKFWRTVEAHVNLQQPQHVRIYESGTSAPQDFITSAGTGTLTSSLIRSNPYHIQGKRDPPTAKVGRWGLQFFAWFHGGIGFHSKICFPKPRRNRTVLTVDGTPHSHGCMRLHHGDSQTVYNALSVGDNVFIYDRAAFKPPSWSATSTP